MSPPANRRLGDVAEDALVAYYAQYWGRERIEEMALFGGLKPDVARRMLAFLDGRNA